MLSTFNWFQYYGGTGYEFVGGVRWLQRPSYYGGLGRDINNDENVMKVVVEDIITEIFQISSPYICTVRRMLCARLPFLFFYITVLLWIFGLEEHPRNLYGQSFMEFKLDNVP